jgi:transposase-like protein
MEKGYVMENCKGCGSVKLTKNGKNKLGIQRYRCGECGGTFIEGDGRLKHGLEKRLKVIRMYLEGVGIRSIERLEGVSNPLIIYWIRHFAALIRKEIRRRPIPDTPKDIAIVEIDELFTYYKKRPNEHIYGLLLTETETRLLTSK